MKRKKQAPGLVSNLFFLIKMTWRYTPGYLIHLICFPLYSAIELFFEFTYGIKFLLELIQYGGAFQTGIRYIGIVAVLIMIKILWAAIAENWLTLRSREILHKRLQEELYRKAVALDLENYDNPQYYTELSWCIQNSCEKTDEMLKDFSNLIRIGSQLLLLGGFVLAQDEVGLFVLLFSVLILLYCYLKTSRLEYEKSGELAPFVRQRDYFNRVFYLQSYAKEVRFHQVKDTLQDKFHESNQETIRVTGAYGRKIALLQFLAEFLSNKLPMEIGYLLYLLYRTLVEKAFSYGSAIALLNAVMDMKDNLQSLALLAASFRKNSLFIDRVRAFLSLERRMESGKEHMIGQDQFRELKISHVSFGYQPGQPILKDVSLLVKRGEKIALVGYNGAGKTTLIKLMLRLYDAQQGQILMNGRDIREYWLDAYRRYFGCVFQDFQIYAATLAENVRMDFAGEEREDVELALLDSGFFSGEADALGSPSHRALLDRELTREFQDQGMYLSGGQNQKIALARCFVGDYPIYIMDEPSSALDPISEYQMNRKLTEFTEDKTVIFISHRLSTTRMADRIYMLEDGRVIEEGSHDELMERDGKYARMFKMQASRYGGTA